MTVDLAQWDGWGPNPIPDCPVPGARIWGWMRVPELVWLGEQAVRMDSIVEVGSLHGRSAFALLSACAGPVYCIDPWDDEHDQCFDSFLGYCGGFPNLRTIRGLSPQAGAQVPGDVDMVFLDGDHSREAITADIEHWLPRTRRLLCGHDYVLDPQLSYPDVRAVVDEMFGDRVSVAPNTSIWAVEL